MKPLLYLGVVLAGKSPSCFLGRLIAVAVALVLQPRQDCGGGGRQGKRWAGWLAGRAPTGPFASTRATRPAPLDRAAVDPCFSLAPPRRLPAARTAVCRPPSARCSSAGAQPERRRGSERESAPESESRAAMSAARRGRRVRANLTLDHVVTPQPTTPTSPDAPGRA